MSKHSMSELKSMQAAPLDVKVMMTQSRIRDWVREFGTDGVYVSFSGGKDSTVLLSIVREMYPEIPAVFVDTGLEYPEIRQFVKTWDNVTWLKPKMNFRKVIETYGYPMISKVVSKSIQCSKKALQELVDKNVITNNDIKQLRLDNAVDYLCREHQKKISGHWAMIKVLGILNRDGKIDKSLYRSKERGSRYNLVKWQFLLKAPFKISSNCCGTMKKSPLHSYNRKTGRKSIIAMMAEESSLRENSWLKNGCNSFDSKEPKSNPMMFWTEQDVLKYIKQNDIPIASVYGDIVPADNQISMTDEKLKTTGCDRTGCVFCGFGCHLEKPGEGRFERLKQTHPKLYDYVMRPWDEGGLGYKGVIDWMNENGNLNIKY